MKRKETYKRALSLKINTETFCLPFGAMSLQHPKTVRVVNTISSIYHIDNGQSKTTQEMSNNCSSDNTCSEQKKCYYKICDDGEHTRSWAISCHIYLNT